MGGSNLMQDNIAIIGLGYVGLPLALELAKNFDVIGFDVSVQRTRELKAHQDRTGVASRETLRNSSLLITSTTSDIVGRAIYIVTVPTPVNLEKQPDLSALLNACKAVGQLMRKGSIIVFESTVYPGVTEEICGPELEQTSGLISGKDFFLGYSPERMNPGDGKHTVDRITKVVAGQTLEVTQKLTQLYGSINGKKIFTAKNIKTAEAAKVIENAQRDINIAFINEVAMICKKTGLSTHEVLTAARTKWNFLDFVPGLVGGHCIGVDPYYLSYWSKINGHNPEVILAGRRINDGMAIFLAEKINKELTQGRKKILMLGLSFKANVPDLRNSKSADLANALKRQGHDIEVHDPVVDAAEAKTVYGFDLLKNLQKVNYFDCVIGSVSHKTYCSFNSHILASLVKNNGLIVDLMGMWQGIELPKTVRRWEL